jgi:hypothetical protein
LLRRVVWQKVIDVSEVFAACIIRAMTKVMALMIKAASTSETSVHFHQITRRKNPEVIHHHTFRRENLKPHKMFLIISTENMRTAITGYCHLYRAGCKVAVHKHQSLKLKLDVVCLP